MKIHIRALLYCLKSLPPKSYIYIHLSYTHTHSYNKILKLFFSSKVNSVYFSCSKIRSICIFEILSETGGKEKKYIPFQFLVTSKEIFVLFLNFISPSWCVSELQNFFFSILVYLFYFRLPLSRNISSAFLFLFSSVSF